MASRVSSSYSVSICIWLAATLLGLAAVTARMPAHAASVTPSGNGHVTIIILDMSGSMGTNDPNGIRCSAANAYIDLSGPGDFIGVIDLDAGVSNDVISPPVEMATQQERAGLKATIQSKTQGCKPDGDTPTAQALSDAATMLKSATSGGLPGSAILLTDGIPYPDASRQVATITNTVVPVFKNAGWPIDVIALGSDESGSGNGIDFHAFLNDVASATSGNFYDDGHGVVNGVNPLNIGAFFVDIFAKRVGRTPGPTIPPTTLRGGTESRNLVIPNLVDHLDVIVVKDQPAMQVSLLDANNRPVTAGPGVLTSTDPHYAIFSVDSPQAGFWTVTASGSGTFLVDTFITPPLQIAIVQPSSDAPVHPLGAPFTIAAQLTHHGAVVTNGYYVQATITYKGNTEGKTPYQQVIPLKLSGDTYSATSTIPQNEPTGTYNLEIDASQTSGNPLASAQTSLRLDLFPAPVLLNAQHAAADPVAARVVQFDPVMVWLYGRQNGFIQWLSNGPLAGAPAAPSASIPGAVELNGAAYCGANVKGTAHPVHNEGATTPIAVKNSGCGNITVTFPSSTAGTYEIDFQTSGTYKDSYGDFGPPVARHAIITIVPATPLQELRAWLWTFLLYPLEIFVLGSFLRSRFLNSPAKASYAIKGQPGPGKPLAQRSLYWWVMQKNIVPSESHFRKSGMALKVDETGTVYARRARWPWIPGRNQWADGRNRPLAKEFQLVQEVYYQTPQNAHYIFTPSRQTPGRPGPGGGRFGPSSRFSGPKGPGPGGPKFSGPGGGPKGPGPRPGGGKSGGPPPRSPRRPAGPPPRR